MILLVALVSTAMLAYSANISREQAMQQARSFLKQRGGALSRSVGGSTVAEPVVKLVDMDTSDGSAEPAYYLFNVGRQEGYVIVAGDDQAPVVLGYSDSGELSASSMPVNMRAWLDGYAAQIAYMREHDIEVQQAKAPSTRVIAPFVTTKWTQSSPYNMMTPSWVQGSSIAKCAVGCLAVAMAQSMSVFRYPSATYNTIPGYVNPTTWKINTGEETIATLDTIPAGTKIDWDNIVDAYVGFEQTLVQRQAVANLMLYLGVSVKTNYSLSSGAVSKRAATSLKTYFGYSQNCVYRERVDYGSDEWDLMVFNELAAGRPVILDGLTSSSPILAEGHAFVCDGYDGNGMFHINWGWNNGSDGYFLLTALNPPDQGTGGSYSGAGFNYDQAAITGIAPAGSPEEIPVIPDEPQNPDDPETPVTPDNPDDPSNTDDPETPVTPVNPQPVDVAPTAAELSLLRLNMEQTIEKAGTLRETSLRYQQYLLEFQKKAQSLKAADDALLEKLAALEEKSNRDDIDSYYHELIVRCITTINKQIVPALETYTNEIENGISFCQGYIDDLSKLSANLEQLKTDVDTVTTRQGFTDIQKLSSDAYTALSGMTGMKIIDVELQEIDYSLRNVENQQGQMNDFYNQIEPLLLDAIEEADPKGEAEHLEWLKRKITAEGDSLEELNRMIRLEEDVRKNVASMQGTLQRSLQTLEDQIQQLLLNIDDLESQYEEASAILSELQQRDLTQTISKARSSLREARRIDKEVIQPKFDTLILLSEDAILNMQSKSAEIGNLMQQYPTEDLLNDVRIRRQKLEQDLLTAKRINSDNRSRMTDISASEGDLLNAITAADDIQKWLLSDLQTAIAIAKEVKAQQDEEKRQQALEASRTELYSLAPRVSTELMALEGDLAISQASFDQCVKAHESVLTMETDFLTEARRIASLLALLPADNTDRQAGQAKLNTLIQYAIQDVPARISSISKQLDEAKSEMATLKSILDNAIQQVPEATEYDDVLQLLTRVSGVDAAIGKLASQLALLRSELASLSQFVSEEPDRLSVTLIRLKELEVDINLAILSVDDVKADDRHVVDSYDLNGRRQRVGSPAVTTPARTGSGRGVRIVRYSDGTVRKVKN